jgi:hypothetical protein
MHESFLRDRKYLIELAYAVELADESEGPQFHQ